MTSLVKRKKSQRGGGGQGRCERSSEAFVKIQKENIYLYFIFFFWGGGGGGGGVRLGGGVRVDVNGEVKLLLKFKKKILGGGVRVVGGRGRVGG